MKRVSAAVVMLVALSLGACGRKGAKECDAYLAKDSECGEDNFKSLSDDERKQAGELMRELCLEAMADDVRGAPNAEIEKMTKELYASMRAKIACGSAASCDEYRNCEKAADAKPKK